MSLFLRSSRNGLFAGSAKLFTKQTTFFNSKRFMGAHPPAVTPESVSERVQDVLRNFGKVDPAKVTRTSHFSKDLGLDSLDTVELVMALEDEFCIEIPEGPADDIASVPDAVAFIYQNPHTT